MAGLTFGLAWGAAALQGLVLLALLWMMGRMQQENAAKTSPVATEQGGPQRLFAPGFAFTELRSGRAFTLEEYLRPAPTLLLFLADRWPPEALAEASAWRRRCGGDLQVLVVVCGGPVAARAVLDAHPELDVASDAGGAVTTLYGVTVTPLGVMVGQTGSVWARSVIADPEHIECLITGRGALLANSRLPEVLGAPEAGRRRTPCAAARRRKKEAAARRGLRQGGGAR